MNSKRILSLTALFGAVLIGVGIYKLTCQTEPVSFVASSTNNAENSKKIVSVPANVQWFDTGIDVTSGAALRIEYQSGQWRNTQDSNYCTGDGKMYDGQNKLILPSALLASLIGKVGTTTFSVGNSFQGKVGSGRLYLSLNDVPGTFNDNNGELIVAISQDESKSLDIRADKVWSDTGINLKSGQLVTIEASGQINVGSPGNAADKWIDPDGWGYLPSQNWLCSNQPCRYVNASNSLGSLIGKIGKNGKPFAIGSRSVFTASDAGTLYLGVDDSFSDERGNLLPEAELQREIYDNNRGSFSVTIRVEGQ